MKIISRVILLSIIIVIIFTFSLQAARVHRVKDKENLFKIAEDYQVTIDEIIKLNNLPDPDDIYQHQVLIIPETETSYTYRVQKGDSLYKISKKLEIDMDELALYNGLNLNDQLYVRQVLYLPPQPQTYVVQKGDSLFKIARKFNITMERLKEENNMQDEVIYQGKELIIPKPSGNPTPRGPNYKKLYPNIFHLFGKTGQRKVALTFDDGPDGTYTPQVLDILKKYNIPATFFVIGNRVEDHPWVLNRMIEEGHIVANHTWSHPDLSNLSQSRLKQEIEHTEGVIKEQLGVKTAYIRPPYGAVSHPVFEYAKSNGYQVINWSVDSQDWLVMDVDQILINTLPAVRNDAIILFHSAGGEGHDLSATVEVLPEIIETLQMIDIEFVSLNDFIKSRPYL